MDTRSNAMSEAAAATPAMVPAVITPRQGGPWLGKREWGAGRWDGPVCGAGAGALGLEWAGAPSLSSAASVSWAALGSAASAPSSCSTTLMPIALSIA